MFDEACCWWILRSCRAALAPALVFVVYSDVSPYSVICSVTDICFARQKDSTMPCLLRANMSAGGRLSPELIHTQREHLVCVISFHHHVSYYVLFKQSLSSFLGERNIKQQH